MGVGNEMWVWGTRCGYGERDVGVGNEMWVWGTRCGYGERDVGVENKKKGVESTYLSQL